MSQSADENHRNINWLAFAGTLFASLSGVALFLGYGVTLAVEVVFGMPHAAVFESTAELLDLSSTALMEIIPTVIKYTSDPQNYIPLYHDNFLLLAVISGLTLLPLLYVGFTKFGNWPRRINLLRFWKPKSVAVLATLSNDGKVSLGKYLALSAAAVIVPFLTPLLAVAIVVVVLYVSIFFALIPLIGMSSGVAYIEKWVLEPPSCHVIQAPADILKGLQEKKVAKGKKSEVEKTADKAATCVAVRKDGEEVARGRVVLQTSKAALLLANDGQVRRVPTTDTVIELVSDISASPDKSPLVKQ